MTHRPIHEELSAQISELSIEDDSSQLIHPEDTGQSERSKHARDAMVLQFFTAFIDFFDSVEAHARDKFTVIGWRDSLSQSAHALYPTEGFRTLVALFIQMEPICGNAAFHFPRKILADASRYGEPIIKHCSGEN